MRLLGPLGIAGCLAASCEAIIEKKVNRTEMWLPSLLVRRSSDDFYHPSSNAWQQLSNGDVFAYRKVKANPWYVLADVVSQISYRTEDTMGNPNLDITTLFVPKQDPESQTMVSYQVAIDSANEQCFPSYSTTNKQFDLWPELYLSLGFVVNMPDHEGQQAAFLAGFKAGKSVLDSIRAVLRAAGAAKYDGFKASRLGQDGTQIGLAGYSGGAFATAHAAAMIDSYAGDLKSLIKTMAIGGVPVTLMTVITKINKAAAAAYIPIGLDGLGREYANVSSAINTYITDEGRENLDKVNTLCQFDALNQLGNIDIYSWFSDPDAFRRATDPTVEANDIPVVDLDMDIFVYNAIQDEIADIGMVDNYVTQNCQKGNRIEYHRDFAIGSSGHAYELFVGLLSGTWMQSIFHGRHIKNCITWIDALQVNPLA